MVRTPLLWLASAIPRHVLQPLQGFFRKALESRITAGVLLAASVFLVGSAAVAGRQFAEHQPMCMFAARTCITGNRQLSYWLIAQHAFQMPAGLKYHGRRCLT